MAYTLEDAVKEILARVDERAKSFGSALQSRQIKATVEVMTELIVSSIAFIKDAINSTNERLDILERRLALTTAKASKPDANSN